MECKITILMNVQDGVISQEMRGGKTMTWNIRTYMGTYQNEDIIVVQIFIMFKKKKKHYFCFSFFFLVNANKHTPGGTRDVLG